MTYVYGQVGEFLAAMRKQRNDPVDRNTMNAWNRIVGTVPEIVEMEVSAKQTDQIVEWFDRDADDLAESTIRNYSQSFRGGVRRFTEYVDYNGSAELTDLKTYLELQEPDDAPEDPVTPPPTHTPAPEVPEAPEETEDYEEEDTVLTTYKFLLRPGLDIEIPIPDDLTSNEVKRFTTWLGTFVISGRR